MLARASWQRLAALTQQPSQQLGAPPCVAQPLLKKRPIIGRITGVNAALTLAVAAGDFAAQVEAHLLAGRSHWWRGEYCSRTPAMSVLCTVRRRWKPRR